MGDQDATNAFAAAAAQDAKIIQARAVAVAPGQLLGIDRSLDRSPLMPLNHGLTAAWTQRCSGKPRPDVLRMARDVASMFDELRALADRHAELHTDRAQLEAELERARQDADRQRADHAELEQVRDELDRTRQDASLWREETDRERARIANLQADAEHTEREMARLRAERNRRGGRGGADCGGPEP